MMSVFLPNTGTGAVLGLVCFAALLAFRSLRRNRAKGCSCGCGGCKKACPHRPCNRRLPN